MEFGVQRLSTNDDGFKATAKINVYNMQTRRIFPMAHVANDTFRLVPYSNNDLSIHLFVVTQLLLSSPPRDFIHR